MQVGKESSDVEYLKQEIQRYKMELINRETNFNRVFSSSRRTPIRPAVPPPTFQDEFEARTCPLIRVRVHALHVIYIMPIYGLAGNRNFVTTCSPNPRPRNMRKTNTKRAASC